MDQHEFTDGTLTARVSSEGAELCSLTQGGHELIWQAGPVWPRHAPVLFPIVGRLVDDQLVYESKIYPMSQHGFARESAFTWLDRTPTGCKLELTDSPASRMLYPFAFRLEIAYELTGGALEMHIRIVNTGDEILPASIGTHPAFAWPLVEGTQKTDYRIRFEREEPFRLLALRDGLMLPNPVPCPIDGDVLQLKPALFARDALILEQPRSSWARLEGPDGKGVQVAWKGFRELGIWSKPPTVQGADFVCIEPWYGHASPDEYDGPFEEKPGLALIPPGTDRSFSLTITPDRMDASLDRAA